MRSFAVWRGGARGRARQRKMTLKTASVKKKKNDTPRQRTTLLAAILGSGVATIDGTIVNVALPAIERDSGGGLSAQQWVANAYLLALGSLILIGGSLGDIYGERRVFGSGRPLRRLLGRLRAGPTIEALIAARGLQGAAGALLVPSSLAIIVAAFPAQRACRRDRRVDRVGRDPVAGRPAGGRPDRRPALVALDLRAQRPVRRSHAPSSIAAVRRRTPIASRRVDFLGAVLCALGSRVVFALIEQPATAGRAPPSSCRSSAGSSRSVFLAYERRAAAADAEAGAVRAPQLRRREPRDPGHVRGPRRSSSSTSPSSCSRSPATAPWRAGLATLPMTLVMFVLSRRFGALADRYGRGCSWEPGR